MARRSLKPQLNQIRAWVRQGRTDAWIAHQLEVSASELREFRRQHDLTADEEEGASQEVDLRDEIEAEIEAATAEEDEAEDEVETEAEDEDETEAEGGSEDAEAESDDEDAEEDGDRPAAGGERPRRRRRRGRRGGRGRRREIEATFDHGETDGYGLWLDAGVKDNPVYVEHWAGKRDVTVRIDPDQIVIRRAGAGQAPEEDAAGE
jgi:hypothetical protein